MIGVTKGVFGRPFVVKAMLAGGIKVHGDSRLDNIARMRNAWIEVPIVLIRLPVPGEIPRAVDLADESLNGSLEIIAALSHEAMAKGKRHDFILMVDLETGREGLQVYDVSAVCQSIATMAGVNLRDLGVYFHFRSEKSFQVGRLKELAMHFKDLEQVAEAVEAIFSACRKPNVVLKELCAII